MLPKSKLFWALWLHCDRLEKSKAKALIWSNANIQSKHVGPQDGGNLLSQKIRPEAGGVAAEQTAWGP